jgi:hypothetical protein
VTQTGSGIQYLTIGSTSYANVSSVGTVTTNSGAGLTLSVGATGVTGGLVLFGGAAIVGSASASLNGGFSATQRFDLDASSANTQPALLIGDSSATGSMTLTCSESAGTTPPWAAISVVLNGATVAAPSTISPFTYSQNVPWFGLGGSASASVIAPQTTEYTNAGSYAYTLPAWLKNGDFIDIIQVGGGAGGQAGATLANGKGGGAGNWQVHTLVCGTDIPLLASITGDVGGAGSAGVGIEGAHGTAGGNTAATYTDVGSTVHTFTATGGAIETSGNFHGLSPGIETYNGVPYPGGAAQVRAQGAGNSPGGGGAGGATVFWFGLSGGAGSPGAVWFVARQA